MSSIIPSNNIDDVLTYNNMALISLRRQYIYIYIYIYINYLNTTLSANDFNLYFSNVRNNLAKNLILILVLIQIYMYIFYHLII